MKTRIFILLTFIVLNNYSQTFNAAEWYKANKFENTISLIQYGGGISSIYLGMENKNTVCIISGLIWIFLAEKYKCDVFKRNLRLYSNEKDLFGVSVQICKKPIRSKIKHK